VGPCTLVRFHSNIFDLSHVPVTVDAARVPETLWNDCMLISVPNHDHVARRVDWALQALLDHILGRISRSPMSQRGQIQSGQTILAGDRTPIAVRSLYGEQLLDLQCDVKWTLLADNVDRPMNFCCRRVSYSHGAFVKQDFALFSLPF